MTRTSTVRNSGRAHQQRILAAVRSLESEKVPSALLLSSASRKARSGDQDFPFHQSTDFFYLTGCEEEDVVLLLHPTKTTGKAKGKKQSYEALLLAQPADKRRALWDGPRPNLRAIAQRLHAELVVTKDLEGEVLRRIRGTQRLFLSNEEGTRAWKVAQRLLARPAHQRGNFPSQFHLCEEILTPLRVRKDRDELAAMGEAAAITSSALFDTVPLLGSGITESFVAGAIDFFFRTREAEPAFHTIVASGKNAATLHHSPSSRTLRADELLLIDCGARIHGYCADITRVLPVSGRFTPIQKTLYQGVLRAQSAAMHSIRAGAKIRDVFLAAAEELTEVLVETRVLRGKVSALVKKRAFAPYFPHGIGHTLGLDVHDVGNLRGNEDAILEAGMVFTVEPGLYFAKKIGRVPQLGIRIEDDVLVTKRGCEIITVGFPKEVDELEELLAPA